MSIELKIHEHPTLELAAFVTQFPAPLGEVPSPPWLLEHLALDAPAPFERSDELRAAVRDMMRHGGYKPTGRGKPASEYLVRAVSEGKLGSINLAVDACNVASLHSGLPISVIDLDLATPPLSVALAAPDTSYVFNASGQEMNIAGLVCLHDAQGPCSNGVKDSQRTKTHDGTQRTLSVVWGTKAAASLAARVATWYQKLLARAGAKTTGVSATSP